MRSASGAHLLVAALLAACAAPVEAPDQAPRDCPPGEICSSRTPFGLQFVSPPLFDNASEPALRPIAAGGAQELQLLYRREITDPLAPLDLPYTAELGGALALSYVLTSVVGVRGVAAGREVLRILDGRDGTLFDRQLVESFAIERIEVVAEGVDPAWPIAFAPVEQQIGVRLYGAEIRLVDGAMKLSLAGATQPTWDTLAVTTAATPGVHPLVIENGAAVTTVELLFVDQADGIVLADDVPVLGGEVGNPEVLCFHAVTGDRVIAGKIAWSFSADRGRVTPLTRVGCVEVTPFLSGTLRLTVGALGASREVAIPVAQ
jgi:hypothetical protein